MSHMPALNNPTLIDVTALEARVTALEDASNLWPSPEIDLTDHMFYVGPMYVTFAGTSGTPVGFHTLTMTGTARMIGVTGTGRQGLISLACGETTDGQCRLHTIAAGAMDSGGLGNCDIIEYECVIAIETLSTSGEEYTVEAGLVGNAPGYGCLLRYQRTVGGVKWLAVTENLGTETVVALDGTTQGGVATVDPGSIENYSLPNVGFFRFRVRLTSPTGLASDPDARAYFYAVKDDGTEQLCATIATNLPTHSLAGSIEILKSAGTTSRAVVVDFAHLYYHYRQQPTPL